ncbi:hypothetical protein DPMN_033586 [Dreissena polymorpha]|uniref:Uncharacterized protein n=1 Tax=Dreissena polymorpha TaxID=45954 RepID=A0A9D4M5Y1_DREPO|nr:hypothetical protein DPMN_033586 [Dreissena polymorpha]
MKGGKNTENSARLKSAVLNALVMVSIEGPDNEAVEEWWMPGTRRSLGNIPNDVRTDNCPS